MRSRTLLFMFIAALFVSVKVNSQNREGRATYGVMIGLPVNTHSGSFTTTDGTFPCCTFDMSETTLNATLGIKGGIALSGDVFLTPRVSYELINSFAAFPGTPYPARASDNSIVTVSIREKLLITMHLFALDILAGYQTDLIGLRVIAGPSIIIPTTIKYKQTSFIDGDHDVRFLDGSRSKVLFDRDLKKTKSFVPGLRFGIGIPIWFGASVVFEPEVLYHLPLSDLTDDSDWNIKTLTLVLGVSF